MSELDNIVAVYRRVDEIATRDGEAVRRIATVVRPYADPTAVGWTRKDGWGRLLAEVPPLDEALAQMAHEVPEGRLRSRRLLALTALIRADPRTYGRDGTDHAAVADALLPLMPETTDDGTSRDDRVPRLLDLLAGVDPLRPFADVSSWGVMLGLARAGSLLDEETAAQTSPPCAAVTERVAAGGGVADALKVTTSFSPPGVTLAQLAAFLDPQNWPHCCALWKAMTPLGTDPRCFLEVIGLSAVSSELRTCLEFERRGAPRQVTLTYQMCTNPVHVASSDGQVTVDQGWIHAEEDASGQLTITTSKLVAFRDFDVASLEVFICVLGYATVGEDMVYSCVTHPSGSPAVPWANDGPHVAAQAAAAPTDGTLTGGAMVGGRPSAGGDVSIGQMFQRLETCLASTRDTVTDALAKAEAGTYRADDLLRDAAKLWAEMLGYWVPPSGTSSPGGAPPSTLAPKTVVVTPAAEVRAVAAITTLSGGFGHTFTAHPAHSTLPANATSVELIPHSPGLPPSDFYTGELTLTSAAGVTKVPIAWEV